MKELKKSIFVGATCVLTYIVNYYLRHILSVLTPTLLSTGEFSVYHIAKLSSTYMLFYALGQLINGFLGDALSPKNMISGGMFVAGISIAVFPFLNSSLFQILCFAFLGFGLSMMRGPLMKIISENTKQSHARFICVFFSFSSFVGPLVASLFAMINAWNFAFIFAGISAVVFGVVAHTVFTVMEKNGTICYLKNKANGLSSIISVFKIDNIFLYIFIACLTEISEASINQWLTTFLTSQLSFSKESANVIFSGIFICRSLMPFITLAIFNLFKEKDIPMMRTAFSIAGVFFALLIFVSNKWVSISILLIALMAMSCVSALLWSIYIPSLAKTGRVSSANGLIDCIGYSSAAGANLVFASVMSNFGWNNVYMLWSLIGVLGFIVTFMFKSKKSDAI